MVSKIDVGQTRRTISTQGSAISPTGVIERSPIFGRAAGLSGGIYKSESFPGDSSSCLREQTLSVLKEERFRPWNFPLLILAASTIDSYWNKELEVELEEWNSMVGRLMATAFPVFCCEASSSDS